MKAKSIIVRTLLGGVCVLAVNTAYEMGQIKGMDDATKIVKDWLEKAKCKEEHD